MHIEELMNEIERFRARRGWNAHHQPAHLAMSICIEAAELLENATGWRAIPRSHRDSRDRDRKSVV